MATLKLAPSILTADFASLGDEVEAVSPYVDWIHLDVMDGHYVPNITFGPDIVGALRRRTDLPFHVHLMIQEPLEYVDRFVQAGAQRISFHPEVVEDLGAALARVRAAGAGVGLAIHPDVALEHLSPYLDQVDVILVMTVRPGFGGQSFLREMVPKIRKARDLVDGQGLVADVEVDGGVNMDTVAEVVEAGADILVAGSAVFDGVDAPAAARRLKEKLEMLGSRDG